MAEPARVDAVFDALANPARRRMLRLVSEAERPSSELAERTRLSRSAASQHLRLLRDADLVEVRQEGRRRLYRAKIDTLEEVLRFLDGFWASRLADLKAAAEAPGDGS